MSTDCSLRISAHFPLMPAKVSAARTGHKGAGIRKGAPRNYRSPSPLPLPFLRVDERGECAADPLFPLCDVQGELAPGPAALTAAVRLGGLRQREDVLDLDGEHA